MRAVLERAEDLTAEWLSWAFQLRVRAFDAEQIGTGQISSSWRITLRYDADPGPSSVEVTTIERVERRRWRRG